MATSTFPPSTPMQQERREVRDVRNARKWPRNGARVASSARAGLLPTKPYRSSQAAAPLCPGRSTYRLSTSLIAPVGGVPRG
jgi:hypothetical protein